MLSWHRRYYFIFFANFSIAESNSLIYDESGNSIQEFLTSMVLRRWICLWCRSRELRAIAMSLELTQRLRISRLSRERRLISNPTWYRWFFERLDFRTVEPRWLTYTPVGYYFFFWRGIIRFTDYHSSYAKRDTSSNSSYSHCLKYSHFFDGEYKTVKRTK